MLFLTGAAMVMLAAGLAAYGWDYYLLDLMQRPFSSKHTLLKPSGIIGLRLGIFGLLLFIAVFMYPLRKYWSFLGRFGKTQNWFNFHVLLGLCTPGVISFHSAFKVQGFAGMAYWTMLALVGSGIIGRYFYAQIPRNIKAAEMSLKEMQDLKATLLDELKLQTIFQNSELEDLFRLPDSATILKMPLFLALARMIAWDITRPVRVWALRRRGAQAQGHLFSGGGIWRTQNPELERTISLASRQMALSKRILFFSRTHQIFHLWHVIHRPFSFSLAAFVIIHVTVVTWLGYF